MTRDLAQRFSLPLENNDRLLKALPAARKTTLGNARILRGKLEGIAGSWVRLTRVGKGLEGAIWDGTDMYVVTQYATIADKLTTPLSASGDQVVVYRLSDTLNALPPEFCGLSDHAAAAASRDSGLQQYKSVVAELRANAITTLSDQLEISLVADSSHCRCQRSNCRVRYPCGRPNPPSPTASTSSPWMVASISTKRWHSRPAWADVSPSASSRVRSTTPST